MPMNDLLQKIRKQYAALDNRGRGLLAGALVIGFISLFFLNSGSPSKTAIAKSEPKEAVVPVKEHAQGYFLSDEIDQKAYVKRLEVQYFSVQEKNQALAVRLDEVVERLTQVVQGQAQLTQRVEDAERRLKESMTRSVDGAIDAPGMALTGGVAPMDPRKYQLDVININPLAVSDDGSVYLPVGSFVSATLLTGVYAPADNTNPLPVLIRLDEAFYGPNEARIPLSGAFAIGKAAGDLNSARALVQVSTLSSVLATGETFEHKGNVGYLTDNAGQLGVKGMVVRNTGGQLALSFMTGFMGGASQALADAQTTTVTTSSGRTTARHVAGSRANNATFQGLAQSAGQMSKYYQGQLDKIIPAVKVEAGVKVYLVVLEGVEIHGLKRNGVHPGGFID